MSFQIEPIDQAKLDALKAIGFGNVQIAELVAFHWPEQPGTICYAMTEYDRLPEYQSLLANAAFQALTSNPIEARFDEKVFQRVETSSSVEDSTITFNLLDDDGRIADLCHLHPEGVKVQILFYFPQVDWLRERWWGHLGTPTEVGGIYTPIPAAYGFRSSQLSLPHRTRGAGCPFMFGGALLTLEEVAANPCKYDRHLGGTHGNLDENGQPFTFCPKTKAASIVRIGDDLEYGGGDTAADTVIVSETKGPIIRATSQGNETNLKDARRVVFGQMSLKEMEALASLVEPDTKHPEKGAAHVLIDGPEGPIKSMTGCTINNQLVGFMHLNIRLGTYRQSRTSFSANVNNYSLSAVFNGVIQGDFRGWQPGQFKGSAKIEGLRDIRVYSTSEEFEEAYTTVPGWCILHMLTNRVWGDGQDYTRFVIQDWIDVAANQSALAAFKDAEGNLYVSTRANFNADLIERTTQQQISDACLYSGVSLPFPFQGQNRIMPLQKEDLTDVPVFTDDLELAASDPSIRLILFDDNGSTLRTKKVKSEGELTNYLVSTFFDAAHDNTQRPLTFPDDAAQMAAGRAAGDWTRRVIKEERSLLGVTDLGQAVRWSNRYLDLGEFDAGGIVNNREAVFLADFLDVLDLHKYKVIKIISRTLDRYGFQYFRIQEMADEEELTVRVRTVAYPENYYEQMENMESVPVRDGNPLDPNPGGGRGAVPCKVTIKSLSVFADEVRLELQHCDDEE